MNTDISYIASIILGSIGIILLITTYVYIDKLEKIGCSCSVHPYRNFIKNYCLFAVVYIFATMFIPPKALVSAIGPIGVAIYFIVKVLFTLTTLIFFVLAFIYTRYLMQEKCKCSEDVRREILYVWSIIQMVILGTAIVIPFLLFNAGVAIALVMSTANDMNDKADAIADMTINPLKNIANVPKNIKESVKAFKKLTSARKVRR